mgnify:CR=1 FL=1
MRNASVKKQTYKDSAKRIAVGVEVGVLGEAGYVVLKFEIHQYLV